MVIAAQEDAVLHQQIAEMDYVIPFLEAPVLELDFDWLLIHKIYTITFFKLSNGFSNLNEINILSISADSSMTLILWQTKIQI